MYIYIYIYICVLICDIFLCVYIHTLIGTDKGFKVGASMALRVSVVEDSVVLLFNGFVMLVREVHIWRTPPLCNRGIIGV